MKITNISEAESNLSELVQRAARGEEIVIGKAGRPLAKLVPYDLDTAARNLDQAVWAGRVWIARDFDELPDSFLQLFSSETPDEPAS